MVASRNERYKDGSASFAGIEDIRRAGLFGNEGSLIGYNDDGRPLRYLSDGPRLTVSGSAGGKTSQVVIPEILTNPKQRRALLDVRGDVLSCVLPALATAGVYAWTWNPTRMHGLASHALQCLDILQLENETFHADCDFCRR